MTHVRPVLAPCRPPPPPSVSSGRPFPFGSAWSWSTSIGGSARLRAWAPLCCSFPACMPSPCCWLRPSRERGRCTGSRQKGGQGLGRAPPRRAPQRASSAERGDARGGSGVAALPLTLGTLCPVRPDRLCHLVHRRHPDHGLPRAHSRLPQAHLLAHPGRQTAPPGTPPPLPLAPVPLSGPTQAFSFPHPSALFLASLELAAASIPAAAGLTGVSCCPGCLSLVSALPPLPAFRPVMPSAHSARLQRFGSSQPPPPPPPPPRGRCPLCWRARRQPHADCPGLYLAYAGCHTLPALAVGLYTNQTGGQPA